MRPTRLRRLLAAVSVVLAAILGLPACGRDAPARSGVVLIVLDTLRADRLSTYGHSRETSPVLDSLAERGVRFDQAISNAPWTLPAMIGLFSGRWPTRRVYDGESLQVSLVETLRDAGVRTAAFTEGGFVSTRFGFGRGFDVHREFRGKVRLENAGRDLDDTEAGGIGASFGAAIEWIESVERRPFFLLVHTYEPHTPYRRRLYATGQTPGRMGATLENRQQERFRTGGMTPRESELAYLRALYDGGVRVADGWVGRLLAALRASGIEDTTVIVTSDHGEDLGERDPKRVGEHGHSLYDELIRVPLIVHDPSERLPAGRIDTQVRLLDVMPTVLDLLRVEAPAETLGRSLLPVMRGEEHRDRPAFSRVTRKGARSASVRIGGFKLVRPLRADSQSGSPGSRTDAASLFDLSLDPRERRPIAQRDHPKRRWLAAALDEQQERLEAEGALDFSIPTEALSEELRDRLRALGYLR